MELASEAFLVCLTHLLGDENSPCRPVKPFKIQSLNFLNISCVVVT